MGNNSAPDGRPFPQQCLNALAQGPTVIEAVLDNVQSDSRQRSSKSLQSYVPQYNDPIKIVCLNFHIFQDAYGKGNFQTSEKARIRQIVSWVNDRYAAPSWSKPQPNPYPKATWPIDTRIRFKIHRYEYYQDPKLHELFISRTDASAAAAQRSAGLQARRAAAVARDPSLLKQLNIYVSVPGQNGGGGGYANFPSTLMAADSSVVYLHTYLPQSESLWGQGDYAFSVLLGHELGHCLDLRHTYASPDAPPICDSAHPDFLADVFGSSQAACPHNAAWDAEFGMSPPKCTNNLMGGTRESAWISRLQAAMMQRALTDKSVRRYLATGCDDCGSCIAFTVRGSGQESSGDPSKLPYEVVDLNEGWGWQVSDFIAPVTGIYHFDLVFQKDVPGTADDVFVLIQKNTTWIGQAWAGEGTIRGTGSVALNVRLEKGDVISTHASSDGGVRRKVSNYIFSGHLLCGCA